jgi:predicted MPP superfamily phosphohydrolase
VARWLGRNWARVVYARRIEPHWLELTRHDVLLDRVPHALHGLRIVHLSDFHAGRHVPLAQLERAVEVANNQAPELIALTGDFIHAGRRYVEPVARVLAHLRARHGVFAVLGNHDFAVRNALGVRARRRLHAQVEEALRKVGITVLRNRSLAVRLRGETLRIVGVDDLWSGACNLDAAFQEAGPDEPTILLAHNPQTIKQLHGRRCDLMLSGHTHGGQVNWPGLGRFLLPQKARRLAAGIYHHRHTVLYVNRGVGHGFRFRFGVRPEVALLRLRAKEVSAS